MANQRHVHDDLVPPNHQIIETRVLDVRHLFNEIDPSPFGERDLDPRVEQFIVEWAEDLPGDSQLALVIHVDETPGRPDEVALLEDAIRRFFAQRAQNTRRRLRNLFRRGRISLVIGLAFVALSIAVGDFVASQFARRGLADIIRESLLIGGWVAMWRPLEVFLYDWWPIRASARLSERMARMPVKIADDGSRGPGVPGQALGGSSF